MQAVLIFLLFAAVTASLFILYFTSGLSFYTFHAIAGLMAIKHQIALCFLKGEYPLWNPFMISGVPFHSGIGILDPLLVSYFFLKGIPALIASAYLALFCAGLSMYSYLRKIWKFSVPASILGGILYLTNPFFGATSHELPFMAPAVYLPFVFWAYSEAVREDSFGLSLLSGFFLSLSFFSGNLESFYFILLFFAVAQTVRIAVENFPKRNFEKAKLALKHLSVSLTSPFFFSAVDLLPTVEMIFDSGRNSSANIIHNLINFILVGTLSALIILWKMRKRVNHSLKWIWAAGLFILFSVNIEWKDSLINFDRNIFYPDLSLLMLNGRDAFQVLKDALGVPSDLLSTFLPPRFIFYIQPPAYLFTLSTLFLFIWVLVFSHSDKLKAWALMAFLLVLFPFTFVPNLNHYLLHLDSIAYPRVMFPFFFILSIVASYGFEVVVRDVKGEGARLKIPAEKIAKPLLILAGLALVGLVILFYWPFDAKRYIEALVSFNQKLDSSSWLGLSLLHLRLTLHGLSFFFRQNPFVFLAAITKFLSLIFLLLAFSRPRPFWKYLFVAFLSFEAVLDWNLYVFQKKDICYVTESFPETQFLYLVTSDERVGTLHEPEITLKNFYDEERPLQLRWNMPLFWNAKTVEGATLNLSPRLFGEFWSLEPQNSYTPTTLEAFPSKVYDLMGLKYFFSAEKVTAPGFRNIKEGAYYKIYENKKALPRFYFSRKVEQKTPSEIKEMIKNKNWDPAKVTLVESKLPKNWEEGKGGASAQIVWERYNQFTLRTESKQTEFLATTEAYNKHWKVYVDGQRRPVVKTNLYFRGVFLKPGVHRVDWHYRPLSFKWGLFLTIISLLALLFGLGRRIQFSKGP